MSSKFVDSRVSKAVRNLKNKDNDKSEVMLTGLPSQDGMRRTTSSIQFGAIREKCLTCCKNSVKIHELCSTHKVEPSLAVKDLLSNRFEKAIINCQPLTLINNNKKLEIFLAERVEKYLTEQVLDRSLQGIQLIQKH